MAQVTRKELQDALAEVDYPAGKDQLLAHAERRGASADVHRALRSLQPVDYRNFEEVLASVHTDVVT